MEPGLNRGALSGRQRDYLALTAFVFARHGYIARALVLTEAILALDDAGGSALFARALLRYLEGNFAGTLSDLDVLEAGQGLNIRMVTPSFYDMSRYLRARCYCETGRRQDGELIARAMLVKSSP